MSLIELVFIAVSLAMDAFTVSMMYGMTLHHLTLLKRFSIAFYFGFFQSIMPLAGFYLGRLFAESIKTIDHYIAFLFLLIIGIHMIKDAFEDEQMESSLHFFDLTILAIATSIDALAVGITFACLRINIVLPVISIGIITFILSVIGVKIGNKFGDKYENKAEFIGGLILILLGIKILLEHLGIINF